MLVAHLDASPDDLVASGSFTLCHQDECWDGVVRHTEQSSRDIATCLPKSRGTFPVMCFVRAEGAGSTMELQFAATKATDTNSFVDGDRVALRVEVGEKTVLDNVRFVQYGRQGCLQCRVAHVELWPDSPTCKTCESGSCEPYVRFEAIVPASVDTSGPSTVTACKNGECRTGRVIRWDWGSTYPFHTGDGGAVNELLERFSPLLEEGPLGKDFRLRVTFRGDTRSFRVGDRFTVEVRSETTGNVLMKRDETVTQYDENYPGGRDCTLVACKQKTFASH